MPKNTDQNKDFLIWQPDYVAVLVLW